MPSNPTEFGDLRFVEIGASAFFKNCFPDQTLHFSTYPGARSDPSNNFFNVSTRTLPQLWRALNDPATSLVVCQPTTFSPWHWQWLTRVVFSRRIFTSGVPLARTSGPQLLRFRIQPRIAVMDMDDLPVINRSNFFLLDQCHVYFKRELPADHWRLFLKTGHPNLPTPRFRRDETFRKRVAKVEPISLGLPQDMYRRLPVAASEKTTDVFFAGQAADSSTVRARGLVELLALRDRGVIVDIPDGAVSPEEFYRRCSRAHLVWSPEGLGWDCFRHYEALACHAVPVINRSGNDRYQPLVQDEHALYYDVEPGNLTRVILAALQDKPRLERIARAGREHVMAHHTPPAIARHIVTRTLVG
jgi:hypothetical protein